MDFQCLSLCRTLEVILVTGAQRETGMLHKQQQGSSLFFVRVRQDNRGM